MVEDIVALPVSEINDDDFHLSDKLNKSWSFKDKNDESKMIKGGFTYVEVYAGKPAAEGKSNKKPVKFTFTLADVMTWQGVQPGSSKYIDAFMGVSLTPEQFAEAKKKVDDVLFDKVWEARHKIMPHDMLEKLEDKPMMRAIWNGIAQRGKVKDVNGDVTDRYQDSLMAKVQLKKISKVGYEVDPGRCSIEDIKETPYSWQLLAGKKLSEVAVEVSMIKFVPGAISVRGEFRLIVASEAASGKVTTKRKAQISQGDAKNKKPAKKAKETSD